MGYINHYGLIFMDSDCSFKSLHLWGSEENYEQNADTPIKHSKQLNDSDFKLGSRRWLFEYKEQKYIGIANRKYKESEV